VGLSEDVYRGQEIETVSSSILGKKKKKRHGTEMRIGNVMVFAGHEPYRESFDITTTFSFGRF